MHIFLLIIAVAVVLAVLYLRHHAAAEAKLAADATKLKNSADAEANKIETTVEADVTKVESKL